MNRDRYGVRGRIAALAILLAFAGCSGTLGVTGFREAARDRQTFETGLRASARVISARISSRQSFFGKVLVTSEKHFLSLQLEGKSLSSEFEVGEEDYRTHPVGSTTPVVVEESGRFLPEFRREALLSAQSAGFWILVALLSGVGFLMGIAESLLYRARVQAAYRTSMRAKDSQAAVWATAARSGPETRRIRPPKI